MFEDREKEKQDLAAGLKELNDTFKSASEGNLLPFKAFGEQELGRDLTDVSSLENQYKQATLKNISDRFGITLDIIREMNISYQLIQVRGSQLLKQTGTSSSNLDDMPESVEMDLKAMSMDMDLILNRTQEYVQLAGQLQNTLIDLSGHDDQTLTDRFNQVINYKVGEKSDELSQADLHEKSLTNEDTLAASSYKLAEAFLKMARLRLGYAGIAEAAYKTPTDPDEYKYAISVAVAMGRMAKDIMTYTDLRLQAAKIYLAGAGTAPKMN